MPRPRLFARSNDAQRTRLLEPLEPRRLLANLAGTIYEDANANRVLDEGDATTAGVVVYLDANGNGRLDQRGFGIDADDYRDGEVLSGSRSLASPSATGVDNLPAFRVRSLDAPELATTGQRVFANDASLQWGTDLRLRFDFIVPVDSVSLDVIGTSATTRTSVVLDAYAHDGTLLDRVRVDDLSNAEIGRFVIRRRQADVRYVVAYVAGDRGSVTFDNLRANDANDERATVTSDLGFYRFPQIPSGRYLVSQQVPEGYEQLSPSPQLSYDVNVNGGVSGLNFGNRTASISGLAFHDQSVIGVYEAARDEVLAGRALYLDVNANGSPDPIDISVYPDSYPLGEVLQYVAPEMTMSVVNAENQPTSERVVAGADQRVNLDGQVFTHEGDASWSREKRLRIDFPAPASFVSLDFMAAGSGQTEVGTLIAYSTSGQVMAATRTPALNHGERAAMVIRREGFDIGYVVAYTIDSELEMGRLDNLQVTVPTEPVVVTDDAGHYTFKPLAAGDHQIRLLPATHQDVTFPSSGFYLQQLSLGDAVEQLHFGVVIGNLPPTAKDDHATTTEDGEVFVDVLANDFDPDGDLDVAAVEVTVAPAHGTVMVEADGTLIYTPAPDFSGADTLVYTVRDDQLAESNSASVSIIVEPVNDAPRTNADVISILGAGISTIGVLNNDHDVDSPILAATVAVVTPPMHGTARVDPITGNIVYASAAGNSDTFTYHVEDLEGLTSPATTVTVVALAFGSAPIARDDEAKFAEGTQAILPVLLNDTDDGRIDPTSIVIVKPPSHGVATLVGDGSIQYRPRLGFVGTDSLDYLVHDNVGLASNIATASIAVAERAFPYQNPLNRFDINGDGFIVPRDALLIINEINERQISDPMSGEIRIGLTPGDRPAAYLDVTGDGFVVARDVLFVVNYLNGPASGFVDTEPVVAAPLSAAAVAAVFASFTPGAGDEDEDGDEMS